MAQATPGSYYTVQQGDTLSSIAQHAYGNANQWQKIYDANRQVIGSDSNHIFPGQVFYIPILSPTPNSYYTVQQGDTLSSIAQQAYGNANQWQAIYDANRQVIGNNPDHIFPGQVLFIPSIAPSLKTCTVTAPNGLNVRAAPTSQSTLIASYSPGTVLNFFEVVNGENVGGNPRWGHSVQGHYFWLGGTDHPNG
jgi:LysM repeat protein